MHTGDYHGLYVFGNFFLKRGARETPPSPQPISFFLRFYEELTEYFMTESCESFLKKANDNIFILIKVHIGGPRAPYLQTL